MHRFWTPLTWALALAGLGGLIALFALPGGAGGMLPFAVMALLALGSMIGVPHIPGNMPGWAIHPLIMDAVKPAVELLRKNADTVGIEAMDHPSGSQWRGRLRMLLIIAVPAAVLIPAGLLGIAAALFSAVLALFTGIPISIWAVAAAALLGALLFPARLLVDLVSRGPTPRDEPPSRKAASPGNVPRHAHAAA